LLKPLEKHCPPGEAVVGIHGRSGLFVDALGPICRPPPKPASVGVEVKKRGGIVKVDEPPPIGGAGTEPTLPPQPPAEPTVTVLEEVYQSYVL